VSCPLCGNPAFSDRPCEETPDRHFGPCPPEHRGQTGTQTDLNQKLDPRYCFVFPQDDPSGAAGLARRGGLTVRELLAGLIYSAACSDGIPRMEPGKAVKSADALLTALRAG
jgi:hypothetical protein